MSAGPAIWQAEGVISREALAAAAQRLARAGCESPRLDAELLLGHVLGVNRASLVLDRDRRLGFEEHERLGCLVARRERREPVAYILGRKGFRHVELSVDPRVLVPRPETELLVDAALDLPKGARVVDVGTGSGAVALALKHERPDLSVCGIDVSDDALEVARANARRLGLDVHFEQGDLLTGYSGPLDAVVANLPYVAERELAGLPAEVAGHEPVLALVGGGDGLDVVRRLVAQAGAARFVALEVGLGQAATVRELLRAVGFEARVPLRDLAGIERVVVGRRG
jgi:release factor glutamine methyltransferase